MARKKIIRFVEIKDEAHAVSVDPKTARLRTRSICGLTVPDRALRLSVDPVDLCEKCREALGG